jgi:hypothetical protein
VEDFGDEIEKKRRPAGTFRILLNDQSPRGIAAWFLSLGQRVGADELFKQRYGLSVAGHVSDRLLQLFRHLRFGL